MVNYAKIFPYYPKRSQLGIQLQTTLGFSPVQFADKMVQAYTPLIISYCVKLMNSELNERTKDLSPLYAISVILY